MATDTHLWNPLASDVALASAITNDGRHRRSEIANNSMVLPTTAPPAYSRDGGSAPNWSCSGLSLIADDKGVTSRRPFRFSLHRRDSCKMARLVCSTTAVTWGTIPAANVTTAPMEFKELRNKVGERLAPPLECVLVTTGDAVPLEDCRTAPPVRNHPISPLHD